MRSRGLTQSRGLVKQAAMSCVAVVLSLSAITSHAVPSKTEMPPCNENGACFNALEEKHGKHKVQSEADVEENVSGTEVFGESVYPKVDGSVSQVGASTLALGTQAVDAVTGTYNEVFDYSGQSSQPDDQIARLEVDQMSLAAEEEENWSESISVPEPATLALMGLGVLGLILLSRRGGSRS